MILPGMVGIIGGITVSGGGGSPGAIPSFRAAGTIAATNIAGPNITPSLPAGTAQDDILLILTKCEAAQTIAAPSGYAEVASSPQSDATAPGAKFQLFWKRAGSSESAPVVTRVGNGIAGLVLGFTNCTLTGNPIDTSNGVGGFNAAAGTITIPAITTATVNCLVVDLIGHSIDSGVGNRFTSWTNASLASPAIGEAAGSDVATSTGPGGGFGASYGGLATPGLTNSTTVTINSSAAWGAIKIALKPLNT